MRNVTHAADVSLYFQLLADSVMDHAFQTLNADGTVASWNRGAQRLFGYSADEITGLPYGVFYPDEARARREAERDLGLARERGQYELESWRVRKDGGLISAYVLLTALKDEQAQIRGYAVVTRDVTAQQRSVHELHDQKLRLRSIVDTAVDAIVIIDERGIIESFNPAGERMFGYRADEVIGKNVSMLMPQPFASEHTSYIQRYLRTGDAKIIGIGREVQARRKDGTIFPADLAVSEFHDGKPLFTGILRDITERKRMEAEVLQIAEAEQRRIGQELHDDVQQQLTGLTMIARHATDSLTPFIALQPELSGVQAKFERVVNGLRNSNQSLRELARGLVPLQVDAHGLRDALARLATVVAEQHSIACTFSAESSLDIHDDGVASNLYRITQEAVNNALRHAGASTIDIRWKTVDRSAMLEVADDGVGLGNDRATTGRGLQIMAYRAGLIGGVLTVRNREVRGTVVSCHLPRPS